MANQYDVLGKAPGLEDLNKLSPNDSSNHKRLKCWLRKNGDTA